MLMLVQVACDGSGFCIMANCIQIIVPLQLFTSREQEYCSSTSGCAAPLCGAPESWDKSKRKTHPSRFRYRIEKNCFGVYFAKSTTLVAIQLTSLYIYIYYTASYKWLIQIIQFKQQHETSMINLPNRVDMNNINFK